MLYKWAPGTQLKPTSERFDTFMARYTDAEAREIEKINLQKSQGNKKYGEQLENKHAQNEVRKVRR